ncbi:hypothetical protein AAZX31_20G134500 [Glycine max]|uniref:Uncharacterized protein n=2 Tax=Glycine subgen. Soja TaxID=1462606 RepID=K7N3I0_SOYBN|nr:hypothetical protein JHK86_056262 [Glycine max]KAG4910404.1 hypothetical protein JHK87_056520 [Glycine soja]KAG4918988.1 hypothetical protein JHK85_057269 [Glycine max]KAG5075072.1 hypothetical protein JHK84_056303 [Glycine max]KAG5077735.1 hypothetical protein JHK82_056430 [Glycine max]
MAANKYVALLLVVFLIAGSANARPKEVSCASICIDKECKSDFNSWCAIFNCGIKCALIGPQKKTETVQRQMVKEQGLTSSRKIQQ